MKLFTKTWEKDISWLKWAFRSVYKYCEEPVVWHVVTENNTCNDVKRIADECTQNSNTNYERNIIIHNLDKWPEVKSIRDSYMGQQWVKMTADRVIGDDVVWNWDSDVLAQKPFKEADFFGDRGLPVYWFSYLDHFKGTPDYSVLRRRADLIESMLGSGKVSCEWMRCMPIPLSGAILKEGAKQQLWAKTYKECVAGNRAISEFNVIGQFAHLYFNNSFDWKNADTDGPTWGGACGSNSFVCQHWSWGGETNEFKNWIQKEFGIK